MIGAMKARSNDASELANPQFPVETASATPLEAISLKKYRHDGRNDYQDKGGVGHIIQHPAFFFFRQFHFFGLVNLIKYSFLANPL